MAPKPAPEIDWVAVRHEYETTDISVRALQRRFGIKSDTAIIRRRDKGNWRKDQHAIAARLVTEAVADMAADGKNAGEIGKYKSINTIEGSATPVPNPAEALHTPHTTAAHIESEPAHTPNSAPPTRQQLRDRTRDREDETVVNRARSMAQIQADAIREQLENATKMRALGLAIAESLAIAASSPDVEQRQAAQRALLSINPDKETFAGLAKAAQSLLDGSTAMQRKVLGMDRPLGSTGGQGGPQVTRPVGELLKRLSLESLMKMREVATEASRLPPPEPEIDNPQDELANA